MKSIIQLAIIGMLAVSNVKAQEREIRRAVERDQAAKHEGQRQKGIQAVDERLDKLDEKDAEFRAGVKPFPTCSYTIDMNFPDKPKNNMVIKYAFKQYDCASEFEDKEGRGETRTITNFKEGKTLVLTTDKKGRKTGMEMDMKMMNGMIRGYAEKESKKIDDGRTSVTATDEYKTIEGYKCRKYRMTNDDFDADLWITQDKTPIGAKEMSFAMANAIGGTKSNLGVSYYNKIQGGVCIQIHSYPKSKRDEEVILTYKNFSATVPTEMFSTAGYEIQKMPSLRDMWDSQKNQR